LFNNRISFTATGDAATNELWSTDGITVDLAADLPSAAAGSGPTLLTPVGNTLFFRATGLGAGSTTIGSELWKYTAANGAALVKDINPGNSASNPANITDVNGIAYFTATDGVNGIELWKSDGTGPNTVPVANINPTGDASPRNLRVVNDPPFLRLYFTATDGV